MIFALRENNFLTLHMMQNYLDVGDELLLRDPDELGNYTVEKLQELAACLRKRNPTLYERYRGQLQAAAHRAADRPATPDDDLVIVPTSSLYIEALVGTHPLLEDFKLLHRALDVKKVQAEVRHAELENIRLAAPGAEGQGRRPDIEKKIVVTEGTHLSSRRTRPMAAPVVPDNSREVVCFDFIFRNAERRAEARAPRCTG